MKKLVTAFALLLIGVGAAGAANLFQGSYTGPSGTYVPTLAPVSITQNLDFTSVTALAGVHCGIGTGEHTDNSFLRRFALFLDHSIVGAYDVLNVDFAVEEAGSNAGTPTQPVDINLYSIGSGAPFLFGNLTLLGTATVQIPNDGSANLQFFNAVVAGQVADPINNDLVVEYFTPDGQGPELNFLWPGCNSNGETRPSYLAASDCGISEPTQVGAIGFPGAMLLIQVNGDEGGSPTPTEDATWSQLKNLY